MNRKLLSYFTTPRVSLEQRIDLGKALRTKYQRALMGRYKPPAKRADPVCTLEKQGASRVPELVPIRYARMLASPFAFFRGSAAIMAADLAATSRDNGLIVQACGDLHIANFGVFASAERNLVFGINDFDETMPGPWEWDLKRLVASVVIGARFLGGDKSLCEEGVRATVESYRKHMKQFARMGNMELWYTTVREEDILDALSDSAREGAIRIIGKARERNHLQVLGKMTDLVDERFLIREDVPFVVRATHTEAGRPIEEGIEKFLESYIPSLADDRKHLLRQYRIVDVARKVVGVGSVGTRCWVVFMQGNHEDDPLFLQIKQAEKSAMAPFVSRSQYRNEGQRVVSGQRLIQGAPDIFLGWGEIGGYHFYVRQLRDMKGGVEFDPAETSVQNMPQYGKLCGWAAALAHAKSGDAAILSGYLGSSEESDDALVKFAFAYAEQNDQDYDAFVKAVRLNRITAGPMETAAS